MYTKKEVLDDVFSVISTYKSCEFKVYKQHGKYSENTIDRFFGNWTNLLEQNGITPPHRRNVRKEEVISDVKKSFAKPIILNKKTILNMENLAVQSSSDILVHGTKC